MGKDRRDLEFPIANLADAGTTRRRPKEVTAIRSLRFLINRTFEFDELPEVHRYVENGGQFGNAGVAAGTSDSMSPTVFASWFEADLSKRCALYAIFWRQGQDQYYASDAPTSVWEHVQRHFAVFGDDANTSPEPAPAGTRRERNLKP